MKNIQKAHKLRQDIYGWLIIVASTAMLVIWYFGNGYVR